MTKQKFEIKLELSECQVIQEESISYLIEGFLKALFLEEYRVNVKELK